MQTKLSAHMDAKGPSAFWLLAPLRALIQKQVSWTEYTISVLAHTVSEGTSVWGSAAFVILS